MYNFNKKSSSNENFTPIMDHVGMDTSGGDHLMPDNNKGASTADCNTQGEKCQILAQHNYHDHSCDSMLPTDPSLLSSESARFPCTNRGGLATPFPLKLYQMLEAIETDGFAHVISWQPHGRCFVVHEQHEFKDILSRYFNKLSKLSSFQRQLNLYGFTRLTRGRDKGGYYHELFLRGRPDLTQMIQRFKVKGTGRRPKSNPDKEPDFWNMPVVGNTVTVTHRTNDVDASRHLTIAHASSHFSASKGSPCYRCKSSSRENISVNSSIVTPSCSNRRPKIYYEEKSGSGDIFLEEFDRCFHSVDGETAQPSLARAPETLAAPIVNKDPGWIQQQQPNQWQSPSACYKRIAKPETKRDLFGDSLDFDTLIDNVLDNKEDLDFADLLRNAIS